MAFHVLDGLDRRVVPHEQTDLDREHDGDGTQVLVRAPVEGADAVIGVIELERVGKAEINFPRIDQRDAGAGAARWLHARLDASGLVEHLGDGCADRVGQRALRAGADPDRLRVCGGGEDDGRARGGNGGETHVILPACFLCRQVTRRELR